MPVRGKKVYIKRYGVGKSSSGDSRFGLAVAFLVCLIFFFACIWGMVGSALHLVRHTPDKFGPGEVVVSQEMSFNFGRNDRGTLSMATLRGKPVVIVGKVEGDGWLLPERSPERFQKLISGAERSEIQVLEHFDMHPYISYGVRFVFLGGLLVVTGLMCLSCVSKWMGW